jgi:hypothetical protein
VLLSNLNRTDHGQRGVAIWQQDLGAKTCQRLGGHSLEISLRKNRCGDTVLQILHWSFNALQSFAWCRLCHIKSLSGCLLLVSGLRNVARLKGVVPLHEEGRARPVDDSYHTLSIYRARRRKTDMVTGKACLSLFRPRHYFPCQCQPQGVARESTGEEY